jgi:hypothetical protein
MALLSRISWIMLAYVCFPIGSVNDIRQTIRACGFPTQSVTTSPHIKAPRTNCGDRPSVVQATQHVINRNVRITLTSLHQCVGRNNLVCRVTGFRIVQGNLRFPYRSLSNGHTFLRLRPYG